MPFSVSMTGGSPQKLYLCLKSTKGITSNRKNAVKYQFTIWNESLSHIMRRSCLKPRSPENVTFSFPFSFPHQTWAYENSAKAMNKIAIGFSYLRNTFTRFTDAKFKEDISVAPWIFFLKKIKHDKLDILDEVLSEIGNTSW